MSEQADPTTAAAILFTVAACMFLAPAVVAAIAWVADRAADREEAKRREVQGRVADAEWLAILAATEPTPIYDALVCESIEREEGWA